MYISKIRRGLSTRRRIKSVVCVEEVENKKSERGDLCEVVRYTVDDDDAAVA